MQPLRVILPIMFAMFVSSADGVATPLSYDSAYGNREGSLQTVACSDGSHGLITRGYTTFGSLPGYPFIGGAEAVEGWNSPNCGACYQLTYTNVTSGSKKSINVLAIDRAKPGFNIALPAMEALVGRHASEIGTAVVDVKQVNPGLCGFR